LIDEQPALGIEVQAIGLVRQWEQWLQRAGAVER
jgi:hypothetical protein